MLQGTRQFRAARKQLRVLTEAFEAVRESGRFGERTGPVRIPVVVHVVYHTDAQNISDEQIKSQLAALDADYQKPQPDVASVPTPFKDRVAIRSSSSRWRSAAPTGRRRPASRARRAPRPSSCTTDPRARP